MRKQSSPRISLPLRVRAQAQPGICQSKYLATVRHRSHKRLVTVLAFQIILRGVHRARK